MLPATCYGLPLYVAFFFGPLVVFWINYLVFAWILTTFVHQVRGI
jgi:hypothetical protein